MPSTRWWEVVGLGLGVGVGAGAVLYYTNQVLRRLHKLENTVGAWARDQQTTLDRQTVLLKRIATSLWIDTATPDGVASSSVQTQGPQLTQGKGRGRGGDVNKVYSY